MAATIRTLGSMTVFEYGMSEWRPEPKPGGFKELGPVSGLCVHWVGGGSTPTSYHGIVDKLRGIYFGHIAGEFVDIAYNCAVDANGAAWELRGIRYQSGANGDEMANQAARSVLYIGGTDVPMTDAAMRRIARLYNQLISSGHLLPGSAIRGHRDFTSTDCPGDYAYHKLEYIRALANSQLNPSKKGTDHMDAYSTIPNVGSFGRFAGKWYPISLPELTQAVASGVPHITHTLEEMNTMRHDWGRS